MENGNILPTAHSLLSTARPGFQGTEPGDCSTQEKTYLEPVPLTDKGLLSPSFVMEDPDSHFIYVCEKMDDSELTNIATYPLSTDVL